MKKEQHLSFRVTLTDDQAECILDCLALSAVVCIDRIVEKNDDHSTIKLAYIKSVYDCLFDQLAGLPIAQRENAHHAIKRERPH